MGSGGNMPDPHATISLREDFHAEEAGEKSCLGLPLSETFVYPKTGIRC